MPSEVVSVTLMLMVTVSLYAVIASQIYFDINDCQLRISHNIIRQVGECDDSHKR